MTMMMMNLLMISVINTMIVVIMRMGMVMTLLVIMMTLDFEASYKYRKNISMIENLLKY